MSGRPLLADRAPGSFMICRQRAVLGRCARSRRPDTPTIAMVRKFSELEEHWMMYIRGCSGSYPALTISAVDSFLPQD